LDHFATSSNLREYPNILEQIMENKLSSGKMEALSRIWRRVLEKEHIGLEDNFFALGGDPWKAIELFRDIQENMGHSFSPLVIYQAPTIASLAVLLEAPNYPPFPRHVPLKSGDLEAPVFLTHGLGGNILEFFDFVKHLQTSRPLYGLQARGTDGLEKPCSTIEEMAHFHVDAVKELQPHGPYMLVGYSLGGLIVLKMARHLAESGETIALLVMIDSYPPLRYAPPGQRLRVLSRKTKHYASRMLRSPAHKAIHRGVRPPEQRSDAPQDAPWHVEVRTSLGVAFTPAMRRVQEYATKALLNYRPRHYHGRIRFVRAGTPLHFPDDPERVWAKFTDQFEVETVTGDHHELLTIHYESLAAVIDRYLRELSAGTFKGS
jgi:acetoacetyl-CoA synthetase